MEKIFWKATHFNDHDWKNEQWNKWEQEFAKRGLKSSVHPLRLRHFILSRISYDKLLLDHPQYFEKSFSHTENIGVCALSPTTNTYPGIDIENTQREVKTALYPYFINDHDTEKYPPIALWSIKEAAFKSFSRALGESGPHGLKNIIINEKTAKFKDSQAFYSLECLQVADQNYWIALSSFKVPVPK
ncbi:MAG: hypothetical protein H6621_08255 [Halobacteriovoraceae bacterium]|nr:hypothetical protein [Halobacteriovoraceae bacterium]